MLIFLGLALMMGRRVLALLWVSIEENRLDKPKSSFVGLSLMVHVIGFSLSFTHYYIYRMVANNVGLWTIISVILA